MDHFADLHPHVLLLKIIANAVYGCFSELNRRFNRHNRQNVEVFSGDIHLIETPSKIEVQGNYAFIPAASLITAGGRLMLAIAQKLIEQAGSCRSMVQPITRPTIIPDSLLRPSLGSAKQFGVLAVGCLAKQIQGLTREACQLAVWLILNRLFIFRLGAREVL